MDKRTRNRRALVGRPHMPERRTGFDRRRRHLILGYLRDDSRALLALLALFITLSVADGLLTAFELSAGLAREGNPVLASIADIDLGLAGVFKLVLTALVAMGIWQGRRYRNVLAVSVLALVLYTALIAYHLGSLWGAGVLGIV